jgi:lipid II:glycine glycyltransferase (peptidoglycan interpeptide bridge formation enzyme)
MTGMVAEHHLARTCESVSLEQWQTMVDQHPDATPLHHRQWIELLMAQYGFRLHLPALRENGEILAATAFLETRTVRGAVKIISLPFTDCFTPLARDDQSLLALVDACRRHLAQGAKTVSIRMDRPIPGFSHERHWVRHRLQLSPAMTDLLPTLASSVRRNIRTATNSSLEFQQRTDVEAVDEFFRLHVLTRRKLGMPVQSRTYFRRLQDMILAGGLGFVGIVRSGDSPIAAAVFLRYKGKMAYKYGASDPAALRQRPNDYLFLNAIQLAARDCQTFDFGVTDRRDEGLRRFKRKWGADEEDMYDVCVAGQPNGFSGDSSALKLASAVIRQSPTIVCRMLGKLFYKYSP